MRHAFGANIRNKPGGIASVPFRFNVPQTGPYADEGADELRAYQLAVKHINGEADGGMLNTLKPLSLKGNGILAQKLTDVTGHTQTKSDAAPPSPTRRLETNGAIMFTGARTPFWEA